MKTNKKTDTRTSDQIFKDMEKAGLFERKSTLATFKQSLIHAQLALKARLFKAQNGQYTYYPDVPYDLDSEAYAAWEDSEAIEVIDAYLKGNVK